jgi:hypothetical protein
MRRYLDGPGEGGGGGGGVVAEREDDWLAYKTKDRCSWTA